MATPFAAPNYDATPVVVAIGDGPGLQETEAAAAALGVRLVAIERIDDRPAAHALWVELGDATTDSLLDQANAVAAQGLPAVVAFGAPLLDEVAARVDAPGVQLLCDAGAADRAAALALALAPVRAGVAEPIGEEESDKLRRLGDEVARIARALAEMAEPAPPRSLAAHDPARDYRGEEPPPIEASEVRRAIRLRRLREQFFDATLFGDPAWDILLDLMAARLERQRVAVSSLCIAAAVPTTTALRWIRAMTDQALLVRAADPRDARRVFIALSDDAAAAMARYFAAARKLGGAAA